MVMIRPRIEIVNPTIIRQVVIEYGMFSIFGQTGNICSRISDI